MKEILDSAIEFAKSNLINLVTTLICILIYIALIFITKQVTKKVIKNAKINKKRTTTIVKMLTSIIKYTLTLIVVIIVLGVWGINLMPVLAGAGILALIVGLGAQDLIKDLIAGIAIVFDDYYDVGDVVEIDGFKGEVIEIGLKTTKIVNYLGNIKIVKNGDISSAINFSRNPSLAICDIEIAYEENVDNVIRVLKENVHILKEKHQEIIDGPNVVGVTKLDSSGIIIRITAKTKAEEHYSVERAMKKFVIDLFNENNIEIPYEKLVIYNGKTNN